MVDTDRVVSLAREKRLVSARAGRRLVAALATAAAAAIIAVSTTLISGRALTSDPVPEYLIVLVDSLYPQTDYVVDEISPFLSGQTIAGASRADGGFGALSEGSNFLDSVWDQVIDQSTD